MFDQRHCTKKDLKLLEDETKKVLSCLDNEECIHTFINLIRRFDEDIASLILNQIKASNGDINIIRDIIIRNTDDLKQNVIVDIYEHS